ncbi:MAG: hypothetical protein J07HX64_01280 [halophilic archaeon J07HX64]|nr:MAG: hypothetical protein J07HX64_01280 [halophilic archaeon J07HX64]
MLLLSVCLLERENSNIAAAVGTVRYLRREVLSALTALVVLLFADSTAAVCQERH